MMSRNAAHRAAALAFARERAMLDARTIARESFARTVRGFAPRGAAWRGRARVRIARRGRGAALVLRAGVVDAAGEALSWSAILGVEDVSSAFGVSSAGAGAQGAVSSVARAVTDKVATTSASVGASVASNAGSPAAAVDAIASGVQKPTFKVAKEAAKEAVKAVDGVTSAKEALPDVPGGVVDAFAGVYNAILHPAYDAIAPDFVKTIVANQWAIESANGYAYYVKSYGYGAEAELAFYVFCAYYLVAKPGVLSWLFDQTFARAAGTALEKKFDVQNIVRGRRLGAGSFGTVFAATDSSTGKELVIKIAKGVQGSSELQNAEAYINRRIARAPLVAAGCAPFLGTYVEVEGARTPCLVWAYQPGETSLEEYLGDRNFPLGLEDALGINASDSDDDAKRVNRVAKKIMRDLLSTTAALHDIGIVHRDLKPANLVLMGNKFKLVDFGAACDLRTGENYDPEQGLLDPNYSPPEQFIMPEKTPAAPPFVAGFLSPFLWTLGQPQLFDSYSAGLILLQLGVPQLRGKNVMAPNGAFQQRLEDNNYDLRKWRREVEDQLRWDFSALDVNGGVAWDLACRLVAKRNIIRRGRLDCGAALAHPFISTPL